MTSEEVSLRGLKILVVEDVYLVAAALCDSLEHCGCTVIGPAGRVREALRLAREEPLDGALLDVDLDGELSFPVAAALAARNVPHVFLSGYDDATVWPPERLGAPRVPKPYRFTDLVHVLAQQIGEATAASR